MGMLDGDDRILGTQGFITFVDFDSPLEEGIVEIPVTESRVKITKYFTGVTSSLNYDRDSDLLFPSKLQVSAEAQGMIQGRFRISRIPQTIIASLYSGTTLPVITFYNSPFRDFCSGYFHINDFELSTPVDGVVDFTATVISEGGIYVNTTPGFSNPPLG